MLTVSAIVDKTEKRMHAVQIAAINGGANPSDDLWKDITIQPEELKNDVGDPTVVPKIRSGCLGIQQHHSKLLSA